MRKALGQGSPQFERRSAGELGFPVQGDGAHLVPIQGFQNSRRPVRKIIQKFKYRPERRSSPFSRRPDNLRILEPSPLLE